MPALSVRAEALSHDILTQHPTHCAWHPVFSALLPASSRIWSTIYQRQAICTTRPLWSTRLSWESHPHFMWSLQHLKLRQSPYWRDKRRESPSKLIRKDHRMCACWAHNLLLPPPAVPRRFLSAPRLQLSTCCIIFPDHPARCAARHQAPRVVTKCPGRLSPRKANITQNK